MVSDRPAAAKSDGSPRALRIYRQVYCLSALLIVLSGFVLNSASPAKIDPMEYRLGVATLIATAVALSFVSELVRRYAYLWLYGLGYVVTLWWLYVTYLNHFVPDDCLGLIVVLVLVDLVYPPGRLMALYQGSTIALSCLLGVLTPSPGIDVVQLTLTMTCLSVIGFVFRRQSRRAEEALRASEERYRTLFENQGEGIGILDMHGRFTLANPAAHEIFGLPAGVLVGEKLRGFCKQEDPQGDLLPSDQSPAVTKQAYEAEITRPDGDRRSLLVTTTPRQDPEGRLTGTFAIFRDVTEQRQVERRLRYLSLHDPLTGLYNRLYFREEMLRLEGGRTTR